MIVKEISIKCDGKDCGQFLDLRAESGPDAREISKARGWKLKHIGHRMKDLCPDCLEIISALERFRRAG